MDMDLRAMPEQQAAFQQAMAAGWQALRRLDFAQGQQHLVQAESLARLPEQQAHVADMQLLANYAARFAEAVQQAATTLPAATEVKLGSARS